MGPLLPHLHIFPDEAPRITCCLSEFLIQRIQELLLFHTTTSVVVCQATIVTEVSLVLFMKL